MTSNVSGPSGVGASFYVGPEARTAAVSGEWNGLAVTAADDPASLLADAAEEMTFAASETVEKKVTERKKSEKESRVAMVVPPSEAMAEMRERLAAKLARLLDAVKAAGGNPAAFRRAVEEFSGDASERHAALLWLEEELAGQPSLAALAKRERETLEAEKPSEIQAGYNIEGVDASQIGGPGEGKDAYRRVVLGHGGVSAMLEEVLARHGADSFVETVDFLRRAVGADLSAAHPSTDKRELEAMNNDLYHLRAIGNFTREFGDSLGKLRETGRKPALPGAGLETLRLFCRVQNERLVALDGLKTILSLEGGRDPVYDVRALTLAGKLAHSLPAKLFADEDSRQRLLAAGQKLLDAAIDLEESQGGE